MKRPGLLVLTAVIALASAETAASRIGTRPRTVWAFGFAQAGTMISTMPRAPFSAVLVVHMEQTLNDGTRIGRDIEEMVKRDGLGRVYRARRIQRPAAKAPDPWVLVTIIDPVHHVQYSCNPLRMCSQMGYRLRASMPRPGGPELGTNRNLTTEDLGTSTISGVTVEGKRVTRVIPEGWVGNDRAFTSTEEVWHSTELDVDVQVIRADPRVGTRTTTMTELSLNEPDPGYFQVPEGYRVTRRMSNVQPLTPLPEESGATFPAGMMPPR